MLNKKNLRTLYAFLLVLFLFFPIITKAGNLPIGAKCSGALTGNGDCVTDQCEDSNKNEEDDNYCVCKLDSDCNVYGTSGRWECVDGDDKSFNINFCKNSNGGRKDPFDEKGEAGLWDAILNSEDFMKATSINEIEQIVKTPQPRIKIPGLVFSKPLLVQEEGTDKVFLYVPFIGEFLVAAYKYAILIFGVLAVIMIIVAGFQWIISPEDHSKAITRIQHAVIGLIIGLSSYTILWIINPDLVNFKNLRVQFVIPDESIPESPEITSEDVQNVGDSAAATQNLTSLPKSAFILYSAGVNQEFRYAQAPLVGAFTKAADAFHTKYPDRKIRINSAFRPGEKQYSLMVKFCDCPEVSALPSENMTRDEIGNLCKKASCDAAKSVSRKDGVLYGPDISHTGGKGLDIVVDGFKAGILCNGQNENVQKSKGVINSNEYKADHCVPEMHQKLIRAMLEAGFCVGLKSTANLRESWHFELPAAGRVSGFCATKDDPNIAKLHYVFND